MLLTFSWLFSTAADYVPMIREDRVWEYVGPYQATPMAEPDAGQVFHYMKFDGTLEVQGKEYHRFVLFKSIYNRFDGENFDNFRTETREGPVYLLREEEGKVFALCQNGCIARNYNPDKADALENLSEFKLYDFTLSDGDTWEYPLATKGDVISDTQSFTVRYLDPISVGGEECKVMAFESEEDHSLLNHISFIEGLGVTYNGSLASFDMRLISGLGNSYEEPKYEAGINRVLDLDGNVVYQREGAICPPTPTYVPMIREDRVWEYVGTFLAPEACGNVFHYMKFDGTMDVQGTEYHKFVLFKSIFESGGEYIKGSERQEPYYLLREEEGKVYILCQNDEIARNYNPGSQNATENLSEFKLYDFTLSNGECIEFPTHTWNINPNGKSPHYVKILSTFNVDGQICRSMALTSFPDEYPDDQYPIKLVEGIGVTQNGSLARFCLELYDSITDNSYQPDINSYLNRVFNGEGNVIYQDENVVVPPSPTYVPMIREDRVWEYVGPYQAPFGAGYAFHYMKFDGTQNVNGTDYHRFVLFKSIYESNGELVKEESREEPYYLLREEEGKVFVLCMDDYIASNYKAGVSDSNHEFEEFKVYDFTLNEGYIWEYPMAAADMGLKSHFLPMTVCYGSPIEVDGEKCRVMSFNGHKPEFIEGLGVTFNGSLPKFNAEISLGLGNCAIEPAHDASLNRAFDSAGNVIYQNETSLLPPTNSVDGVLDDVKLTMSWKDNEVVAVGGGDAVVTLEVIGIDGAKRATASGRGHAVADLTQLAPGVYVVRVSDGSNVKTAKIMINYE